MTEMVDDSDDAPLTDDLLLDEIVRALVTRPSEVRVSSQEKGRNKVLTVHANRLDRGRVIGKEGKTIRILEQLMDMVGRPRGVRIELRVEQDANFKSRQNGSRERGAVRREPEVLSRRGTAA
jgi:uncharacterized protein